MKKTEGIEKMKVRATKTKNSKAKAIKTAKVVSKKTKSVKVKEEKNNVKKVEPMIHFEEERDGRFDESGDWNGSMMTDKAIKSIKDEKERILCEKLDRLQEDLKSAKDNGEDYSCISNLLSEISRVRVELNKINLNYID